MSLDRTKFSEMCYHRYSEWHQTATYIGEIEQFLQEINTKGVEVKLKGYTETTVGIATSIMGRATITTMVELARPIEEFKANFFDAFEADLKRAWPTEPLPHTHTITPEAWAAAKNGPPQSYQSVQFKVIAIPGTVTAIRESAGDITVAVAIQTAAPDIYEKLCDATSNRNRPYQVAIRNGDTSYEVFDPNMLLPLNADPDRPITIIVSKGAS